MCGKLLTAVTPLVQTARKWAADHPGAELILIGAGGDGTDASRRRLIAVANALLVRVHRRRRIR
jgi:hypothetical protein